MRVAIVANHDVFHAAQHLGYTAARRTVAILVCFVAADFAFVAVIIVAVAAVIVAVVVVQRSEVSRSMFLRLRAVVS